MKYLVAFSSPKRSAKTVEFAARQAKALDAEVILLRVVPDPEKVGVVAQLIATERPAEKAREQVDEIANNLQQQGVRAQGIVKIGSVAETIMTVAKELQVDLLYVGTTNRPGKSMFMEKDPIVTYLVNNCPISLCLIRQPDLPLDVE